MRLTLDPQNFYSRKYILEGPRNVGTGDAYFLVEVSDKPEYPEDGDYHLSVYLGRERIGVREFCYGYIFGKKPLGKEQIDAEMDCIIFDFFTENNWDLGGMVADYDKRYAEN